MSKMTSGQRHLLTLSQKTLPTKCPMLAQPSIWDVTIVKGVNLVNCKITGNCVVTDNPVGEY